MGRIDEILEKIEEVLKSGHEPKYIIMSPKAVAELVQDQRFMDVSSYSGTAQSPRRGEIGKIFGIPVIIVTDFDTLSPTKYFEENENPSSRSKIKPKEIIVVSDIV